MRTPPCPSPLAYCHLTARVTEMIRQFMVDSRRHEGAEARMWAERAYGLYLGWRYFSVEMVETSVFDQDDKTLEALIGDR